MLIVELLCTEPHPIVVIYRDLIVDAMQQNLSMSCMRDSSSLGKELHTVVQKGLDALKKCWPVGWLGAVVFVLIR